MTVLNKALSRVTARKMGGRNIVVTLAPAGAQNEALIGMRLKGQRTQYLGAVSSLYQVLALWHANKEAKAKREARKNGIPWKQAKKQFTKENSL